MKSSACWRVATLLGNHGNRSPRGGLSLNPGGQFLIEWLSGCKTDGDVYRLYSKWHTEQMRSSQRASE